VSVPVDLLMAAAEQEWLESWTVGPTEPLGIGLPMGSTAPDLALVDEIGATRRLSEFWADGPALIMFWRHFGCGCGVSRAALLREDLETYRAAGLTPVAIAQGEPERAATYRATYDLPCSILCDPRHDAYRAFGIGHWPVERILYDAPTEFWSHARDVGVAFQASRRTEGRPLVDDPWRQVIEFVVGTNGKVRLSYSYQHCEDFPRPSVLTSAAQLS
jgi:peroxiredoxin